MRPLCLVAIMILSSNLSAQVKKFTIPPQEIVGSIITDKESYLHPAFETGTVLFQSGATSAGILNYHSLYDEIHYISKRKDTLSISNEADLTYITILNDTFYYSGGFVKLLASAKDIKLVVKNTITLSEKQKSTGGYGYSSTAGIESFNAIESKRIFRTLSSNELMIFIQEPLYFFYDRDLKLAVANKNNLMSVYRPSKKILENYLKENPVNFKKEADLLRLMQFIGEKL
jgi:hypothetical protein